MASPALTARTLITNSLLLMGAIASGETPTASELSDGLSRLNELIDNWAVQSLTALVNERHVFSVVADQSTYLLGPASSGATLLVANRPPLITNASRLLNTSSPPLEQALNILTDDEYAQLSIKTLSQTLFTAVYYNQTSPAGTVFLWPTPTTAQNDLVLYFDSILSQFADLTTSYILPAGYAKALRYNLAVELAPEFGRSIDPVIAMTASAALRQLKAVNVKPTELMIDPALNGTQTQAYNILTDGYN